MSTIDPRSYDWVYQLGCITVSVLTTAAVSILLFLYGLAVGYSGVVTALNGKVEGTVFLGFIVAMIFAPISLGIRWVLLRQLTGRQTWGVLAIFVGIVVPAGLFVSSSSSEWVLIIEGSFTPGLWYVINQAKILLWMCWWGCLAAVIVVGGPLAGVKLREYSDGD